MSFCFMMAEFSVFILLMVYPISSFPFVLIFLTDQLRFIQNKTCQMLDSSRFISNQRPLTKLIGSTVPNDAFFVCFPSAFAILNIPLYQHYDYTHPKNERKKTLHLFSKGNAWGCINYIISIIALKLENILMKEPW